MQQSDCFDPKSQDSWICPSLGTYWQLGKLKSSNQFVLRSPYSKQRFLFTPVEGYALQHFTGQYAIAQIQTQIAQKFPDTPPNFVQTLISRLLEEGILSVGEVEEKPKASLLKSSVEWHYNADGYWILRNQEDRTFIQVGREDKAIIDQLGTKPRAEILAEFGIPPAKLQTLLQMLAATGMLEGSQPPKRQRGKFNPMQLLFFKFPLFNPDPWLNRNIAYLRWLWTKSFAIVLGVFLLLSGAIALDRRDAILSMGQRLMEGQGASLFIPFAFLSVFVVTLHELGHAFTLKYYNRQVPEVGLLFMCLFPAAYTDTTDQYCLSQGKRILVVAAGVLVQITIAAIALLFWNLSVEGSGLHTASYLLMVAALFTVAVNLNPLAKFDGYYLSVAVTGINNLRNRAFGFYGNLFTGKPIRERAKDRLVLAIYAPFSLFYIWFVFGFLFYRLTDWTLVNAPTIAAMLLIAWAIYYFFPTASKT
ncbi:hypothetical protein [Lusitaniella coriacea]|uniref:hypothetical protein n=1 Tax=Lusitaniella coriacea TaxID=1983105 RepID=UPI003CF24F88